ncbi:hypothetical protein L0Y69_00935 [bacterium]|nr:hypothetical protein [bacterium]
MLKVTRLTGKDLKSVRGYDDHQAVFFLADLTSGLQAYVAIHRTIGGIAVGGTRMFPYAGGRQDGLLDALSLSSAMTSKMALANIRLGGGKATILGDPGAPKPPGLIDSFGEGLNSIAQRYGIKFYAAEDSGFSTEDIGSLAKVTPYAVGRPKISGDPSKMTAIGVAVGIDLCCERRFASSPPDVTQILTDGACGHVGRYLTSILHRRGYTLHLSDIKREAVQELAQSMGVRATFNLEQEITWAYCNGVLCLCSTPGGFITEKKAATLGCKIVAGATNNQLASAKAGEILYKDGVTYAPDIAINAGGIINVGEEMIELLGGPKYCPKRAEKRVIETIRGNLEKIFRYSEEMNVPEFKIALILANEAFKHLV